MNVELTRVKVKKGKSRQVDEWMQLLNQHMKDVLLTLKDEKMYVETIFRERRNGEEWLYWYSIQGECGVHVEDSEHWIDHKHVAYWYECIDPDVEPVDFSTEVVMIPEMLKEKMNVL